MWLRPLICDCHQPIHEREVTLCGSINRPGRESSVVSSTQLSQQKKNCEDKDLHCLGLRFIVREVGRSHRPRRTSFAKRGFGFFVVAFPRMVPVEPPVGSSVRGTPIRRSYLHLSRFHCATQLFAVRTLPCVHSGT